MIAMIIFKTIVANRVQESIGNEKASLCMNQGWKFLTDVKSSKQPDKSKEARLTLPLGFPVDPEKFQNLFMYD